MECNVTSSTYTCLQHIGRAPQINPSLIFTQGLKWISVDFQWPACHLQGNLRGVPKYPKYSNVHRAQISSSFYTQFVSITWLVHQKTAELKLCVEFSSLSGREFFTVFHITIVNYGQIFHFAQLHASAKTQVRRALGHVYSLLSLAFPSPAGLLVVLRIQQLPF